MTRLCERPACSEPGAIAYGFDADRLLVWLTPLDPSADRNRAGVLCLRHADSMVVPIGWTLDDARDPTPRLFKAARTPRRTGGRKSGRQSRAGRGAADSSVTPLPRRPDTQLSLDETATVHVGPSGPDPTPATGEGEPAVEQTVAEVTGVSAAAAEDPDATVAIPWKPDFDDTDDLDGLLDATSPLLARAFTGRRVGRANGGAPVTPPR